MGLDGGDLVGLEALGGSSNNLFLRDRLIDLLVVGRLVLVDHFEELNVGL